MSGLINRERNGSQPRLDKVIPGAALPGAEVEIVGTNLGPVANEIPSAFVDGVPAHVLLSRAGRLLLRVPETNGAGTVQIQQGALASNTLRLRVAQGLATEVHAVGNPVIDMEGNVFVTFSGSRGTE